VLHPSLEAHNNNHVEDNNHVSLEKELEEAEETLLEHLKGLHLELELELDLLRPVLPP
jgi:hypothetical protein